MSGGNDELASEFEIILAETYLQGSPARFAGRAVRRCPGLHV